MMLRWPALAPDFDALPVSPHVCILRTSASVRTLTGPGWGEVVPRLNGKQTEDEIADLLQSKVSLALTYFAILTLAREGVVGEKPDAHPHREPVGVQPGPNLAVIFVDDYLNLALPDAIHSQIARSRRVVPCRISGSSIWIGPSLGPDAATATVCWNHLIRRLYQNRFDHSTRVAHPPAGEAIETALRWIQATSPVGDRIWTGSAGRATPDRVHYLRPTTLEHTVSPLIGTALGVDRIADRPYFVEQAWHLWPSPALSAGKGADPEQSRTACIAEAAERHSAGWMPHKATRRAAFQSFANGSAVDPNTLMQFSSRQLQAMGLSPIPVTLELDWVEARTIPDGEARSIPAAYCYFGHPEARYFGATADSNGCAAGKDLEFATEGAFLELVERDAVALWWYNRLPKPELRVEADSPIVRTLRDAVTSVCFLDLTSDLGVPVVAALVSGPDGVPSQIGFGAAWDVRHAIDKAALEAGQLLASRSQGDVGPENWLRSAYALHPVFLRPAGVKAAFSAVGSMNEVARRSGIEILRVDLTCADTGRIPVVRVICPGLRPAWARFAPGRLFDVPVRMGWLPRRLAEEELNPIPYIL